MAADPATSGMDTATLIVELVKALAWPVAVIVLLIMLRKPLIEFLPHARKLKYKNFEIELSEQVRELEKRAARELPAQPAAAAAPAGSLEGLHKLTQVSPAAAVMEAWREVEGGAARLIAEHDIRLETDTHTPFRRIQQTLSEHKLVDRSKLRLFSDLRQLRNKVAHARDYEISPQQAARYVDVAARLKGHLDAQMANT